MARHLALVRQVGHLARAPRVERSMSDRSATSEHEGRGRAVPMPVAARHSGHAAREYPFRRDTADASAAGAP